MLPDRVSKPGPLTYESGALPIALRGPAISEGKGQLCVQRCRVKVFGYVFLLHRLSLNPSQRILKSLVRPLYTGIKELHDCAVWFEFSLFC